MTQEEKQLVLQDLCARLPYPPICHIVGENGAEIDDILTTSTIQNLDVWVVKPYLRPMSSMTEEEKVEYCDLQDKFLLGSQYPVTDGHILFDWLNKKMFDYRGLIPKGLAISTDMTKEELNEAWCKYMGKCSTEIMQALAFALRWCDENPHWISVKDRKPKLKHSDDNTKYSDTVIVTNGKYRTSARWLYYPWGGWYGWYDAGDEELKGITHWMPLPAPPKKGGEE